ncbi:synaptonemal complex protein 2 [Thalassophryne amazonica]|uniref:synaptonemal complex protein 2 n=1 Tax=Thalassophryne amazonica TaxID=390379 RepID=UPI0014726483|nr:synaptonemal complex protein 2 [Thalassophryne amazonica]
MATSQDKQLEKVIDEALKSSDLQALDLFLQRDVYEEAHLKCSQQILNKLDKLISRGLDQKDARSANLGLTVLYKCGRNLTLPGGQRLLETVPQSLINKMVQWFEKCRQLWIQCGPQRNESLLNLSEDFFDALMVVHEASREGSYKVTESFLYPIGELAVDRRIYILIQKEAVRKFNMILGKITMDLKKEKILKSQEASNTMIKLAGYILDGGDYDLQTALMEALCRMATAEQRKELADCWFSMGHVAKAFVKISDSQFETDCRKFLNMVNGMQGDRRRVYSYPCLEVFLDKHELMMPSDEKLEEFWIDFNVGSHSISFYFSLADEETQESQWETMSIHENEVQRYTVKEEDAKRQVLQIKLSDVVAAGVVEGSELKIFFSSSLDILQAARSVYGHSKNTNFVGKTNTSVVKTTVRVIMEENASQVVPESQVSVSESEKSTAPYLFSKQSAPIQVVTPAMTKTSEPNTFINSGAEKHAHAASSQSTAKQKKSKGKSSLESVHSCDKKGTVSSGELKTAVKSSSHGTFHSTRAGDPEDKNIPTVESDNVDITDQDAVDHNFVPDTQPITEKSITPHWSKRSISEMIMMPTQKMSSVQKPEPNTSLARGQKRSAPGSGPVSHAELTRRLQVVVDERNQSAATPEPPQSLRKNSEMGKDTKSRSPVDQCASTLRAPKEPRTQRAGLVTEKCKGQMSRGADPVPVRNTLQERITPSLKDKTIKGITRKEKRDAEVAGSMVKLISSHYNIKTKSAAKVTGDSVPHCWIPPLVNRSSFDMSWLATTKKEQPGSVSFLKLQNKSSGNSEKQREDIFAFTVESLSDIGANTTHGKNRSSINVSAISCSDVHDSSTRKCTTKKGPPVAKAKRYVKKHLFSDTDTDCGMTEVSWLRESSRKPKPKVTKYSNPVAVKKTASPNTACESPDWPPLSPKPVKGNGRKQNKKKLCTGEMQAKAEEKPPTASKRRAAAGKRPPRAAATTTKSYREPNTDDSQSEPEQPPAPKQRKSDKFCHEAAHMKKKKAQLSKNTKTNDKLESDQLASAQPVSKKQECVFPQWKGETTCSNASKEKKKKKTHLDLEHQPLLKQKPRYVQRGTTMLNKKNVAAQHRTQASSPSPLSIEKMRAAGRSTLILDLTCSPPLTPRRSPPLASFKPPCQDTPSPILLQPKSHSTVSSKGNSKPSSFCSANMKHSTSKMHYMQSLSSLTSKGQKSPPCPPTAPGALEISPVQRCPPSPPQPSLSLSSHAPLTSTLLDLDKPSLPSPPQSPFPNVNYDLRYGSSKASPVSWASVSRSSTKSTGRIKKRKAESTLSPVMPHTIETTPPSRWDPKPAQHHTSGPNHKHHITYSFSSDSEENEKEEVKISKMRSQHSPRMKPRKLFRSLIEHAEAEVSHVMSSSHTLNSTHWDIEAVDEDLEVMEATVNPSSMCQRFSSELKKKFEGRSKLMEVYNKQSLNTVQLHVSSLGEQINKYRTQRLEQVCRTLLEEIQKLEQDEALLKNMEKDHAVYWKKQSTAFRSYLQQYNSSFEALRKALQSNVCHSTEYEERTFAAQMCLIRKDMRSLQDKLLSEMQEGEIQSMRRGLHALFFPGGARF